MAIFYLLVYLIS